MPGEEIVDSHIHLFSHRRGSAYGLGDLAADVDRSDYAVTRAVYVECGQGYRSDGPVHLRAVGETETVVRAIDEAAVSGPELAAIVGYADLSGSDLDEVLDAHVAAGRGLFKGIRQATAYDADPLVPRLPQNPPQDLMRREEFLAGLVGLSSRRLSYDAYVYHPQLPALAAAARAVPQVTIILNHLGAPLSAGRYAARRSEVMAAWRDATTELAECPNVAVKIGGIGMPLLGFVPEQPGTPVSGAQLADATGPAIAHLLTVFGAERCLAESNFPIDRATCTYQSFWEAVEILLGDLAPGQQQLVLSGTASLLYRL